MTEFIVRRLRRNIVGTRSEQSSIGTSRPSQRRGAWQQEHTNATDSCGKNHKPFLLGKHLSWCQPCMYSFLELSHPWLRYSIFAESNDTLFMRDMTSAIRDVVV